jgi:hypothetical protein
MLEAGKVLAAAKEIADHDERAVFLEEHFARVERPGELLEDWFDACYLGETRGIDDIVERARVLADSYAESPAFLSTLGKLLDWYNEPADCIAVLDRAVVRPDATAAAACADRALQLDPDTPRAFDVQIEIAIATGDAETLHRLCHLTWLALAEAHLSAGDLSAATDAAQRSHEIEPRGDELEIRAAARSMP